MTDESWKQKFSALAPLVMASLQVIGPQRSSVRYAFRLEPNNEYDSGWNFWSGEETQEYVDDADHFDICPLKAFLELDPSLQQIVDSPIGSAWERESDGPWTPAQYEDDEEKI